MKTTETEMREEPAMILCRILSMPVKRWFLIAALVLFSMALCVVVFAGEPVQCSDSCEAPSGLAAALNLSQKQRENLQQLADQFSNDTATTRGKIIEKRFEHKRLSEDPKANPYAINKAQQTEVDQRRLLTPEQINKIKNMPYGYDSQGYGRK